MMFLVKIGTLGRYRLKYGCVISSVDGMREKNSGLMCWSLLLLTHGHSKTQRLVCLCRYVGFWG